MLLPCFIFFRSNRQRRTLHSVQLSDLWPRHTSACVRDAYAKQIFSTELNWVRQQAADCSSSSTRKMHYFQKSMIKKRSSYIYNSNPHISCFRDFRYSKKRLKVRTKISSMFSPPSESWMVESVVEITSVFKNPNFWRGWKSIPLVLKGLSSLRLKCLILHIWLMGLFLLYKLINAVLNPNDSFFIS